TRRTRPRRVTRAKPRADTNASQRSDFGAVIDLIADAKKRGLYDPQNRRRLLAKPTMTSGAGAPFARIVADAKTEDQALRAFEAAAREEGVVPADAFVVGELVKASAIVYGGHPRAGLTLICVRGERHFSVN